MFPKIGVFPQIIHLFIGFSSIFTIHFGVSIFFGNTHIIIQLMVSEHKLELVNLLTLHTTAAKPLHACRRLGPWLQHQRPDFQMLLLRLVICPSIYCRGLKRHIQTVCFFGISEPSIPKITEKPNMPERPQATILETHPPARNWDLRLGWEKMKSTSTKHNQGLGQTTPEISKIVNFCPKTFCRSPLDLQGPHSSDSVR